MTAAVDRAGRIHAGTRRPVLIDIGARDGLPPGWRELAAQGVIDAVGFEPAAAHCAELRALEPHVKYLPLAVGAEAGRGRLFITRMPGCSSLLEPDDIILADYPIRRIFEVVDAQEVDVETLDNLVREGIVPRPDFLKIDTQGSELSVLHGAARVLGSVTGIELEAQFRPIYRGQALFTDILAFLTARGFVLRDVRQGGPYEGEMLEVDALFSLRPTSNDPDQLALLELWQRASSLKSPKFLAQMRGTRGWTEEYFAYLTPDDTRTADALASPLTPIP